MTRSLAEVRKTSFTCSLLHSTYLFGLILLFYEYFILVILVLLLFIIDPVSQIGYLRFWRLLLGFAKRFCIWILVFIWFQCVLQIIHCPIQAIRLISGRQVFLPECERIHFLGIEELCCFVFSLIQRRCQYSAIVFFLLVTFLIISRLISVGIDFDCRLCALIGLASLLFITFILCYFLDLVCFLFLLQVLFGCFWFLFFFAHFNAALLLLRLIHFNFVK